MTDTEALADSIFVAVKDYCAVEFNRLLRAELDARMQPVAAMCDATIVRALVEVDKRIAEIPIPKDGAPGQDGASGVDGKDGADGKDGVDGKQGESGKDGADGRDGVDGKDGADGMAGKDGVDGKDGAPGLDGKDGADGINGKDGAPGLDGKDGSDGLAGKDGAAGVDGKDGLDGKDGARGIDGKDGAPGVDGKDGAPGINGKDGAIGARGIKGEDGRDGRDGKQGEPGRDALQIDILGAIDPERSYARGTFANYEGGLVRSVRVTDPLGDGAIELAGWQIVIDGFSGVNFENVDERSTKVSLLRTSGKAVEHVVRWPVMIYRGTWKDGSYTRGDTVTRGGSIWHCECDTDAAPGDSPHWKLAAKKGENGKDGRTGPAGERGVPGPAGRDFTNLGTLIK